MADLIWDREVIMIDEAIWVWGGLASKTYRVLAAA